VYAFVTGSVRQHWEEAQTHNDKLKFEETMSKLFQGLDVRPFSKSKSWFITQEEEGGLELLGSRRFYENLHQDGLLEKGTMVVACFGIGKGSSQWVTMKLNGDTEVTGHKAGMNNLAGLSKVGETILGEYRNERKLNAFLDALESVPHPVIALKSGCILVLDLAEQ
jgi:hypothetical protein